MPRTVYIAQVIQDAHDFDLWGNRMAQAHISKIIGEFLDRLTESKINFVVVGGIAMLAYVEGRNTKVIDLIVALQELERVRDVKITSQDEDFARANYRGLTIDVLKADNKLFNLVRQHHSTSSEYQGHKFRLATANGLALLKLYALPSLYRQGSFDRVALYETDIAQLMQQYPMNAQQLLSTLKPFLSETDLATLQEILNDIEKRISRFRKRPR